jgi:hypothetical protein
VFTSLSQPKCDAEGEQAVEIISARMRGEKSSRERERERGRRRRDGR